MNPKCTSLQKMITSPGDCCPQCVDKVDCAIVSCLRPNCTSNQEIYNPIGACCPKCRTKQHNCLTREVWSHVKKVWCCTHEQRGCKEPACGGFGGIPCPQGQVCIIDSKNCKADCLGVCKKNHVIFSIISVKNVWSMAVLCFRVAANALNSVQWM
eukprot:TRINITY_DN531_c0_g1_i2.p2 TRINITY_DN531_c0_g1~~TRINITY_DN531_c0_g1_i2.p2  ORF type:complete len:155 (+),score=32.03 TRINITY_DN531_c0_g1_i2:99-563(+)